MSKRSKLNVEQRLTETLRFLEKKASKCRIGKNISLCSACLEKKECGILNNIKTLCNDLKQDK